MYLLVFLVGFCIFLLNCNKLFICTNSLLVLGICYSFILWAILLVYQRKGVRARDLRVKCQEKQLAWQVLRHSKFTIKPKEFISMNSFWIDLGYVERDIKHHESHTFIWFVVVFMLCFIFVITYLVSLRFVHKRDIWISCYMGHDWFFGVLLLLQLIH